jgi:hypothetical protein
LHQTDSNRFKQKGLLRAISQQAFLLPSAVAMTMTAGGGGRQPEARIMIGHDRR